MKRKSFLDMLVRADAIPTEMIALGTCGGSDKRCLSLIEDITCHVMRTSTTHVY